MHHSQPENAFIPSGSLDPGNSQRCAVACWVTQVTSIDVLSWGSSKQSLTVQLVEHVRVLNIAARSGSCHQATRGRGGGREGGEKEMQRFIMDCRMTIRQTMKQILRPKAKSKSKVKGQLRDKKRPPPRNKEQRART